MSELLNIKSSFDQKMKTVENKENLQNLKTEFFGKNGQVTNQLKNLGSLSEDKKKEFATSLNKLKNDLSSQIENKIF